MSPLRTISGAAEIHHHHHAPAPEQPSSWRGEERLVWWLIVLLLLLLFLHAHGWAQAAPGVTDACAVKTKTHVKISVTSVGAGYTQIVAPSAGKRQIVCQVHVVFSAATTWTLAEGTKISTDCDTSTNQFDGLMPMGGTNAPGISIGNGLGSVATGTVASGQLCLYVSTAVTVTGGAEVVQAP